MQAITTTPIVQANFVDIPEDTLKLIGNDLDFGSCRNLRATCKYSYENEPLKKQQLAMFDQALMCGRMYKLPTSDELSSVQRKQSWCDTMMRVPIAVMGITLIACTLSDRSPGSLFDSSPRSPLSIAACISIFVTVMVLHCYCPPSDPQAKKYLVADYHQFKKHKQTDT